MLMGMFKVSRLSIWTASPSQVIINKGTSQNIPEVILNIDSVDANWLKDFVLSKHTQPVAPTPEVTPTPQNIVN